MRVRLKDGRELVVNRFTEGNKDRVAEMMESLSEEAVRWGMPPYNRERLQRGWWSNMKNVTALVAIDRDRIAGYAGLRKFSHPRRRGNSDYVIYLHQDYHNVGLGTAMTRRIIELAREEGFIGSASASWRTTRSPSGSTRRSASWSRASSETPSSTTGGPRHDPDKADT